MNRDYSDVLIEGPWNHEFVSANGTRFHVVTAGNDDRTAPLIVLLHGFPQFWWAWRHQIPALAEAGYRVAAIDMRGSGASDKPPTGYDVPTRTRDIAGVIRSLGHKDAIIVGHGIGGTTAWAMPTLQPAVTRAVAALSAPHPAHLHASLRSSTTRSAYAQLQFMKVGPLATKALLKPDNLGKAMNTWAYKPFGTEELGIYANALGIPFAAHNSLEPIRWYTSLLASPLSRRFSHAVRTPITIPALQLQGARDGFLRKENAAVDASALCLNFRYEVLPNAGYFLPEEDPSGVTTVLLDWLKDSVDKVTA